MKLFNMITTALAGAADWNSWGSSVQNKNQKKQKKNSSCVHEIVELMTPPPSMFVPGHTVLDESIPSIHVDAYADSSFDFSEMMPSLENHLLVLRSKLSFRKPQNSVRYEIVELLTPAPSMFFTGYTVLDDSIPFIHVHADRSFDFYGMVPTLEDLLVLHEHFVPSTHDVLLKVEKFKFKVQKLIAACAHDVLLKVEKFKFKVQELIAAEVKNWKELTTAIAGTMRRCMITLMKEHTTILSGYVWNLMVLTETMWQWRLILQAVSVVYQLSAASTVWATLFKAVFPHLFAAFRLLKMVYGLYKVCRFLRSCLNAVRTVRRLRVRSVADAVRALASLVMQRIVALLWSALREALQWILTVLLFRVIFVFLFR